MGKIGLGITTTSGRKDVFLKTIYNIQLRTPNAILAIVAGVSGIAQAKNECLRRLDGLDHIFLFDDDCFPLVENWHLPYINSGEPHLSYTFNRKIIKKANGLIHYEMPNGCMMYIHRKCLETVGGFDEGFKVWGYDHVNYSQRVFNAGLTSSPFMDVEGSEKLIYSLDRKHEVKSTVTPRERRQYIPINKKRFLEQKDSKEFMPYRNQDG